MLAALQGSHVRQMIVHITHSADAERHAIGHQRSILPPDLTRRDALEECPDGHAAHLCGGLEANAGCDLLVVQEPEPLLPNKLAVSQKTGDSLGRQD